MNNGINNTETTKKKLKEILFSQPNENGIQMKNYKT